MKFIFNIILLSLVVFGAKAQNNGAVFTFQEETHDFGNVLEGPAAVYNFEFTNTGNEPLVIQNCSASCGCTTPSWSKDPIMPGGKGKITVSYDTKNRVGPISKTVYIQSNAVSSKERFELYIRGNVVAAANPDKVKLAPSVQKYIRRSRTTRN